MEQLTSVHVHAEASNAETRDSRVQACVVDPRVTSTAIQTMSAVLREKVHSKRLLVCKKKPRVACTRVAIVQRRFPSKHKQKNELSRVR